jgi:uncharacterized membrane protein YeaQ/YmgE (transglycosylase-associated protein family)
MGVLSALPIISAGNSCCCLWVMSGGFVAAYLLQQSQSAPITPADGALTGFLAGIVGAFIYLVLSVPIDLVLGPMEREMIRRLVENMGGAQGFRDYADRAELVAAPIRIVLGFILMLFLGAIFSTIGGLIGAMAFRKTPPSVSFDAPSL